jgi:hypothetical protein
MFIRFAVDRIDPVSQKRRGIFHAVRELRDNGELQNHELEKMNEIMEWFASNLKKPDKFNRSHRKNASDKAISWFRDSAKEHSGRIYEIVSVLKNHGINVTVIKSSKVGFIVYKDEYQICAEPFSDTNT